MRPGIYEYDAAAVSVIFGRLTLGAVRVTHQAKSLAVRCGEKGTSYKSPSLGGP